jgi:hypothetical protein
MTRCQRGRWRRGNRRRRTRGNGRGRNRPPAFCSCVFDWRVGFRENRAQQLPDLPTMHYTAGWGALLTLIGTLSGALSGAG